MDIPVGAEVSCNDGPCGRLTHVVVNPVTEEVTDVVVRENHLPHTEYLVPLKMVQASSPKGVSLSCTASELAKQAHFVGTRFVKMENHEAEALSFLPQYFGSYNQGMVLWPYVTPAMPDEQYIPIQYQAIPPEDLAVARGAHVEATDGRIGRVDEFVVDDKSGHITHLVLREGHLWGKREIAIPVSEIDRIEEDVVYLKLDKQAVDELPPVPVDRKWS